MKRAVTLLCLLVVAATAAPAQDEWLELLRADFRADKVAIVTAAMELSSEESSTFWPIYRAYEQELSALGDRRVALLKQYAAAYPNVTEEMAAQIASDSFKIQDDLLKLRKKYYKQVEKALSSGVAARFVQVEYQIGLVVDLQIASEVPLIHAVPSPATSS